MTEIKLNLDDPGMAARQLRHAANHWNDGVPKPNPVGDLLRTVADSIEEQVKPAIAEPTETFSVVRAKCENGDPGLFWVRLPSGFWTSDAPEEYGVTSTPWRMLHVSEVIRVGIGEQESADEWQRLHVANAQTEAYTKGAEDFAAKVRREIATLRAKVVTGPEKRTCDDLLALVGVLQGLS